MISLDAIELTEFNPVFDYMANLYYKSWSNSANNTDFRNVFILDCKDIDLKSFVNLIDKLYFDDNKYVCNA